MHDFAEFVVVLALGVLGGGFVLTIGIVARNTFKSLHLFRPAHLLYAMALLGSAAALGKAGVAVGCVILLGWLGVLTSQSRRETLACAVVNLLVALCLGSLLWFVVPRGLRTVGRMNCLCHLKQLTLALHNYHDVHGELPPAYVADEAGRPKHSWRVLLLPYIEQRELYERYNFDEPWDGPNNSRLLRSMPESFRCPSTSRQGEPRAGYLAVVGSRTTWPGARGRKFDEFVDGLSSTILIVEASESQPLWTEPKDFSFDEAAQLMTTELKIAAAHTDETLFYEFFAGRNVGMADGAVGLIGQDFPPKIWRSALLTDDGAGLPVDWAKSHSQKPGRLKWGNLLRFSLFLLFSLLPLAKRPSPSQRVGIGRPDTRPGKDSSPHRQIRL